jgi:GWxTD domain-containing protein
MTVSPWQRFAVFLCLLISTAVVPGRQKPKPLPDEKPRKISREPKKAFVDWIKDVDPILTQAERDAWKKLQTDEEREQFIQEVWRGRDPDPDTEENEFKEQFYERVTYANEHFSSGKPGRMTDRGRIYIKFGKPDSIESHPAGGPYERPSYEGGGSTTTYPFEKWYYRYIAGVSSDVELEFVDPTGSGEYRLARNPYEKDALLYVPGAGPTLAEMLFGQDKSARIAGANGYGMANYMRAKDSPFEVMDLHRGLEEDRPLERNTIRELIDRPKVDDNPLNFSHQFNYFRLTDNRVMAVLTIQTENSELSFKDSGGLQIARLNIYGRVKTVADRRVGTFEDAVTTTAIAAELSTTRTRSSAYAKALLLEPGRYKVDVIVRDIESGAYGIEHIGFVVPEFPADRLSTSSVVLAAKLESTAAGAPAVSPFTIGTTRVIPNLTGVFTKNQAVGVYLQVYNAAIDQTTLRPAADVEYVLLKDGKEIGKQSEEWREINDSGQRLTLSRLIDTRSLTPGEYQVQVRIHDQITNQTITPSAIFKIVP